MLKVIHIVTSVLAVFIISLFFIPDQSVTVVQSIQGQVAAGQEFVVELTVGKGDIDGFASLQQHLPKGFTATPFLTGNAKFSFEDQFVKFVWFALPEQAINTVSYTVKVDSNIAASEEMLTGIFSYIENDKTKTIDVNPVHIQIHKAAENAANNSSGLPATDGIEIERNMPDTLSPGNDVLVQLTVKNKSVHGSAKIVEHIPQGWIAEKVESGGALFKVQDSLVKFIWLNIPVDSVLHLSYRVKPGKNLKASQSIYGTFAFDDHGTPRSFDYFPSLIFSTASESNPPVARKDAVDPVSLAIKESAIQNPPSQAALLAMATSTPAPENGIVYKVQIAACRRDVKDVHYFNQHYHLEEPVSAEMNDGWHKYVIGGFDKYSNARNMRVNTNEKVNGAFVVAYNNGQRVTVREALNASKQKWVQ